MSTISPRVCPAQETPRARKASACLALPIKDTYVQICFIALLKKSRPILVIYVARILIISLCFVLLHSSMNLRISLCDSARGISLHDSVKALGASLFHCKSDSQFASPSAALWDVSESVCSVSKSQRCNANRHKLLEDINRTMPSMPSVWLLSLPPYMFPTQGFLPALLLQKRESTVYF